MEQTECSETSACKIQVPGNYPEENIQQVVYYIAVWRQNTLGNIPELNGVPFHLSLVLNSQSIPLHHPAVIGLRGSTPFALVSVLNCWYILVNPLNAELNPICHFLALLGSHPILHFSRIRVKMPTTFVTYGTTVKTTRNTNVTRGNSHKRL
jgi:hypothetical protein